MKTTTKFALVIIVIIIVAVIYLMNEENKALKLENQRLSHQMDAKKAWEERTPAGFNRNPETKG